MDLAHVLLYLCVAVIEVTSVNWKVIGGRHRYTTVEDLQSWQDSETHCVQLGGHLYSAYNQTEEDAVVSNVLLSAEDEERFWIGLSDTEQEGQYRWSDNSTTDYRNYDAADPPRNNSCVYLQKNRTASTWFRDGCAANLKSICESPSGEVTTPLPVEQTPGKVTPPTGLFCPSGWIQVNESCFQVFGFGEGNRRNWTDAVQACKDVGAQLATIHSQAVQSLMVAELLLANDANVWIGLYAESNQDFQWEDGSPVDFEKWALGQPDRPQQNMGCVELLNNVDETGRWNDDDCSYVGGYACELPADISYFHTTGPVFDVCERSGFEPYRDSCFHVGLQPRNFSEGEAYCKDKLSDLTSVVDGYEEAFIESLLFRNDLDSAWIGLKDIEDEGIYKWLDGWPVWYTNWGNNEPSRGGDEGCVALTSDATWNDTLCAVQRPSICKFTSDIKPTEPSHVPGYCPGDWKAYDADCYFAYTTTTNASTWYEASAHCQSMGAHLVSIHSKYENEFVEELTKSMGEDFFWIGLYRNDQDGFSWTDFSPVQYDYWGNREPAPEEDYDCGVFLPSFGHWAVELCSEMKGFICKAPKVPATPTPTAGRTTMNYMPSTTKLTTEVTTPPLTISSGPSPGYMTTSEKTSTITAATTMNGRTTGTGITRTTFPSTTASQSTPTNEPSSTKASTTSAGEPADTGLSTGAIVGICIGCAVFGAAVAVFVIFIVKGRISIPKFGGDGINSVSSSVYVYETGGDKMRVDDKASILP